MWIDALEATIDKDRIGTHWETCYLEHKDCAVLRLIGYARQLERENKALSEHNKRMVAGLEQDAKRHSLYGPCDGFDDGACAECNRLFEALQRENKALSMNAENLEIVRKQRDEARDIARKLLAYIRIESEPDIGDLGMYTQVRREKWYKRKLALLSAFPEWLRGEIEG